jgi:hypothetical protein
VSKWDCDSFHPLHLHFSVKQFYQFCVQMGLWLIPFISLYFSVEQFYQFGVQMRLWVISLTISTRSHPTVLWSWCPHPTVLSVWWPNEIVADFSHFLYTLVWNCFIRSQIVTHSTQNYYLYMCMSMRRCDAQLYAVPNPY